MTTKATPKVLTWIIPATFITGILLAALVFYAAKPCTCTAPHKATNHATADLPMHDKNYILITGPNGDAVKLSPKFSKLVQYVSDDNAATADDNKADAWKSKFKEWRDKMSSANVTLSLTNFMDIVELSKVVDEN